jgi:hypothetical protein
VIGVIPAVLVLGIILALFVRKTYIKK